MHWSTCRRCWSSICQVRSVAINQQATDSLAGTTLGDDGLITIAPAFQCLRNLRALKLRRLQLCRSIDSLTHQHQVAELVLLGSERWHLSSSTCHHCSCLTCQVRAFKISHHIMRSADNVMGALSEAELEQLQMYALELRHLQQLSALDLYGADCVNATSE